MGSVLFKQRHVSKSDKRVRGKNVAHVNYIATRIGVVFNPLCGFELWGNLEDSSVVGNINDLDVAKKIVGVASKSHTLYRAIFSLEHTDAFTHGYYDRDKWQELISENINIVAKEMNIDSKAFKWCAAYHHKKGHPHVHVVYWDNSDKIRNEFIPADRFKVTCEKIRAAFNKEVFREEIKVLQGAQENALTEMKDEFVKELNAFMGGFDLDMETENETPAPTEKRKAGQEVFCFDFISQDKLNSFFKKMIEIEESLPKKGALKYKFLPPQAKSAVDEYTDELLDTDAFKKLKDEYLKMAGKVAEQYGNGKDSIAHYVSKADDNLHKVLGNQILAFMKKSSIIETLKKGGLRGADDEVKNLLLQNLVNEFSEKEVAEIEETYSSAVFDSIHESVHSSLEDVSTDLGYAYAQLLKAMPQHLTPAAVWLSKEKNRTLFYDCCEKFMKSEPLVTQMGKYGAFKAGTYHFDGSAKQRTEIADYFNNRKGAITTVNADDVDKKLAEKYILSKSYSEIYKECSSLIYKEAKEDKGWADEERCNIVVRSLLGVFRSFEQDMRNERNRLPTIFMGIEKSKQAKKELSLKLKNKGLDWGEER